MRWLIGIFAVLVMLWCSWWFAGRYVILDQASRLIEDQRQQGATLDLPGFGLAGFPSRFDVTVMSYPLACRPRASCSPAWPAPTIMILRIVLSP